MDEIISYKMCAVKVRNAKLRNYLNYAVSKQIVEWQIQFCISLFNICDQVYINIRENIY
jgi:hypothetical protein